MTIDSDMLLAPMSDDYTRGDVIRRRRERVGWTQAQLCEASGVRSEKTIRRVESGDARIQLRNFRKVEEALTRAERQRGLPPLASLDLELDQASDRAREVARTYDSLEGDLQSYVDQCLTMVHRWHRERRTKS